MNTFEHQRAPSLSEILAGSFASGFCAQHELERAAALKGYSSLQVEMALSRAEREGVLVREVVFRVASEPEPEPEPPKAPAAVPTAQKSTYRRDRGFWLGVREKLAAMRVGDEIDLRQYGSDLKEFAKHIAVNLYRWRRDQKLQGEFTTRRMPETVCVRVTRLP